MSKKLSWKERMQNFTKKAKKTDERLAAGVEKFGNGVHETMDNFQDGVIKFADGVTKACIEQIVNSEVRRVEMKAKHPDIDFEAIEAKLDYSESFNTKVKPKNPNVEHMAGSEVLIAELKAKHPNLDWEALEEKIIEDLRY